MNRAQHAEYVASAMWVARREKFKRDHGRHCFACGSTSKPNVHHVRYTNAGAGREPDRDLRLLCETHHKLAHKYEKSGRYGRFMANGTLAAATQAMITDVRGAKSSPNRPPTRRDNHGPQSRSPSRRKQSKSGFGAAVGTALTVIVMLVFIGIIRNGSSSPSVQQPPFSVSSVAPVAQTPPPSPDPYLVQSGDTLQQIADSAGVSVADLMAWNPDITDPNYIEVSQAVVTAAPR
jgi:LysM repeat protein